ncbi:hypothetical protein NDU88_001146 [Pleurodeles waltl]|uniref:Uncharacterized protein n=1 Tax=Pleurodeles waltl TaxID=8319 RepID=A0AAV7L8X9_PLEWA|nr:hypothetical protein NDU88_001146 [Pleurodeles waltl]
MHFLHSLEEEGGGGWMTQRPGPGQDILRRFSSAASSVLDPLLGHKPTTGMRTIGAAGAAAGYLRGSICIAALVTTMTDWTPFCYVYSHLFYL